MNIIVTSTVRRTNYNDTVSATTVRFPYLPAARQSDIHEHMAPPTTTSRGRIRRRVAQGGKQYQVCTRLLLMILFSMLLTSHTTRGFQTAGWSFPFYIARMHRVHPHCHRKQPKNVFFHNADNHRRSPHLLHSSSRSSAESTMDHASFQQQSSETGSPLLSLRLHDLATMLGGYGRALACWDCFRLGIDPIWFHSSSSSLHCRNLTNDGDARICEPMDLSTIEITASSSSSSERIIQLQPWTRSQIQDHMPAARRHNSGLGHATLELLTSHTSNLPETVARLKHITTSHDGTTKLLLQLGPHHVDNNNNNSTTSTTMIETVIIPWPERQSSTLCVSSQVGCRQACTFCATGRIMGRGRNLTADEILAQVYWAQKVTRLLGNTSNNNHHDDEYGSTLSSSSVSSLLLLYPIDNVVFMGMGEPADNAPHVMRAVQVLLDPMQFQLTPRKVTISTVAPTPQAFAWLSSGSSRDDALAVSLAWSIHSSRDDIRKRLVPTTRYSMVELRQGLIQTLQGRPKKFRSILLSVTLLHQINDHQEDAMHLIQFCQAIFQQVPNVKLVVNVIPWNPFEPSLGDNVVSTFTSRPLDLAPPTWERILAFQNILMQHHIMCYIRTIRGDDTNSACGQLATAVATRKQS